MAENQKDEDLAVIEGQDGSATVEVQKKLTSKMALIVPKTVIRMQILLMMTILMTMKSFVRRNATVVVLKKT